MTERLSVADQVQPVPRPAFTKRGGSEQTLDDFFVSLG
jgi:hypothetical protein